MRVAFFGTASFAVPALRAIAPHVILVVSQPDRPSGRGMRLHASPVKLEAESLGLPVETPERSRAPEFVARLEALAPDVLVVAAYGQILSTRLLESARQGGINLHGSILPRYRGAAPIQRCLVAGDAETGVSLMQMDRGMDTGDMIEIRRLAIGPDETYGQLQDRLATLAAGQIADWLPRLVAGDYPRVPQDHAAATMAPKIEKAEAELSFERPSEAEYNRFRAFTPSPGAFVRTNVGALRLWNLSRAPATSALPGAVLRTSPNLEVAFHSGALVFDEVQPEGKKRMRGNDFANGARLRVGDRLI